MGSGFSCDFCSLLPPPHFQFFFLMFPRSRLAFPSSTPSKISDSYTTVRAWELKSNALDLVHWETKSISSVDWVAVAKCLHG